MLVERQTFAHENSSIHAYEVNVCDYENTNACVHANWCMWLESINAYELVNGCI